MASTGQFVHSGMGYWEVIQTGPTTSEKAIEGWLKKNKEAVEPTEQLLSELWTTEINDLSMIAVASRSIRAMTEAGPG